MFEATNDILNTLLSVMNQDLIIGFMFIAALGYLVNLFWTRTRKPHACNDSCTGCSSINVNEIENKFKSPLPQDFYLKRVAHFKPKINSTPANPRAEISDMFI